MQRKKKSVRDAFKKQFSRGKNQEETSSTYGDVLLLGGKGVGKTSIANRLVYSYFTEKYEPTTSEQKYDVDALLEIGEDEVVVKKEDKMILKNSFKKSVFGKNRPSPRRSGTSVRKATLNVANMPRSPDERHVSDAYALGLQLGMKKLRFSLVDTPSNMSQMQPIAYQAMINNASGFFLVCSFDNAESLHCIEKLLKDVRTTDDSGPVVIIANKSDICEDDRVLNEDEVRERANELNVKYCCASMASIDGYEEMAQMLLNEINISAEKEDYERSLPEDQAYFDEEGYY